MPKPIELPPALIESVKNGRVVLFLGAGASMEAKTQQGASAPSAGSLAKSLQERFLGSSEPNPDLMFTADVTARTAGAHVVSEFIRATLSALEPSSAHMALPSFRWHTIATTNYDTLVEDAYAKASSPLQDLLKFVKDREPIEERRSTVNRPLDFIKLHGCIDHAHDPEIPLVLDPAHYERFKLNRERLYARLEDKAHELPFLFIGYGLSDPHIRNIIHRLERTGQRPEYYIVTPSPNPTHVAYWRNHRIVAIDATFSDFMVALDKTIPGLFRVITPHRAEENLPLRRFFRTTSDPSERTLTSLKSDLTHVHAAMPIGKGPPKDFYRGYDDGFSAIARDLDAFRRVTNDLLVDLIDEHESGRTLFCLLRGPGGAGKTVTLKRAAWETSTTFDSPAFWLEDGGVLKPEVLNDLYNLIGRRLYVFVDRAAERIRMLNEALRFCLEHRLPITFVAAERDSTWNVTREDFDERWKTKSYSIGQLHSKEIIALLTKLEEHKALGVLFGLPQDERIHAFEQADRHLLVALHEVTAGKPFEDIVLDECSLIRPEEAKQLYLDICTLGQFDAAARAGVIHRISGIPFSKYENDFFLPLENVVLTDRNPYGDYQYRARHKRVASMVFKGHFATDEQRRDQIVRIVGSLDEGYRSDSIALGSLTKAHNLRRLISDINVGRAIYKDFIRIIGEQWFLLQQNAIFELHHPDGSLDRAEELCSQALQLSEERESVLHTHAEIARRRAQHARSGVEREVYRRQAYERLGRVNVGGSAFVDGSRCKLRLDEVEEALHEVDENDDETVRVFAERCRLALETLERARIRHPADSEFAELEARFYQITDKTAQARRALERAWELHPQRPTVALQLAKMHRRTGEVAAEKLIILSALERHGADTSVHLSAAQFFLRSENERERAAFHFARSYTKSDRNYVARFEHAQYLFDNGEGDQAALLFAEVDELAPHEFRQPHSHNRADYTDKERRYTGRIEKIEDTYAFISMPTYPNNIYANISQSDEQEWERLKRGSSVTFAVGFLRNGPVALCLQSRHLP